MPVEEKTEMESRSKASQKMPVKKEKSETLRTHEPIVRSGYPSEHMGRASGQKIKTTPVTAEMLEKDVPCPHGMLRYGPNLPNSCCYYRYWEPSGTLEDPALITPVIAFASGRIFGRAFLPSGSLYLHTSLPKRHQQLIASRDDAPETRGSALRGATPVRIPACNRAKSQPKRSVDLQRPMSGVSQTASSPLNHGPICRINDRHDVLTPDSYFDAEPKNSPSDVLEGLMDPSPSSSTFQSHHLEEESPQLKAYRRQIAELELELELLRTETERQRREREKYQKLYESTALCQICMERRRNSLILPCSHFIYCCECLERHWEITKFRQCPLCRGPAHSVIITNLVC